MCSDCPEKVRKFDRDLCGESEHQLKMFAVFLVKLKE